MARRMTDTGKWDDPWFCGLTAAEKLFWFYLCDKCDHAGIWKVNIPLAKFHLGLEAAISPGPLGDRIYILSEDKWFIKKFVDFQYGTLNPENRAHQSVINILEKEGACKVLTTPLQGCKDKDKVRDKVRDKVKLEGDVGVDSGFDRFWKAYPNKKARLKALASWLKIKPDETLVTTILAAVAAHTGSPDWLKDGGQFIPHPATWLNQRRWEDEIRKYSASRPSVQSSGDTPKSRAMNGDPKLSPDDHPDWTRFSFSERDSLMATYNSSMRRKESERLNAAHDRMRAEA